jgi:hypothetical protein
MLLSNYSVLSRNTGRALGNAFTNPHAQFKATQLNNFYTGEHVTTGETDRSAWPNGYNPHASYYPALVAGGLGSSRAIRGSGDLTGSGALGRNMTASLSGSGDLVGIGQLIVSMAASLSGSGTISGAQLQAFLQLSASLSGAGDLSGSLLGKGALVAALSGAGDLESTIRATGALAASINVTGGTLTTANVADAILDDVDGVESGLTVRQALRLIAAAVGGKLSGAATTTITIRNAVADGKDRVIATVDSSGNRSAITYDLDD